MIEHLTIQNFQSHKLTELDFEEGVNVIVGRSDSGKTSVLRALDWIINNKPAGDAFRSSWGGDTKVSLEFDKTIITRSKGKTNTYTLDDNLPLKAFGQNVPEEITKAINISELNYQRQMDSPFLLSQSSGEVARFLNEIVNLDAIDRALSDINSKRLACLRQIESTKESIERRKDYLQNFKNLEEIEGNLSYLEGTHSSYLQKKELSIALRTILGSMKQVRKDLERYSKLNKIEDLFEKLRKKSERIEKIRSKCEKLRLITSGITRVKTKIKRQEKRIRAEAKIKTLIERHKRLEQIKHERLELEKRLVLVQKASRELKFVTNNLKSMQAKFKKEMPKICPLCNQKTRS